MKRLISLVAAIGLILGIATPAFAANPPGQLGYEGHSGNQGGNNGNNSNNGPPGN